MRSAARPARPIVRTLAPVMAGVSRMNYRTFVTYNVIGGIGWGVGVTTLGYFLGQVEFVHDNIEAMILVIVAVSVLPIAFELLRGRARRRTEATDEQGDRAGTKGEALQ